MNLYQKIVPIVIVLGILGGCTQYSIKPPEKRRYKESIMRLLEDNCDKQYNEGPFFEDIPCDEDIFPRRDNDWVEDLW